MCFKGAGVHLDIVDMSSKIVLKWSIVAALTMASGKLFQLRIVLGTKEYIW